MATSEEYRCICPSVTSGYPAFAHLPGCMYARTEATSEQLLAYHRELLLREDETIRMDVVAGREYRITTEGTYPEGHSARRWPR